MTHSEAVAIARSGEGAIVAELRRLDLDYNEKIKYPRLVDMLRKALYDIGDLVGEPKSHAIAIHAAGFTGEESDAPDSGK